MYFHNSKDISRYVGIPHYFGESSFEKCDCFGLCKLFFINHGWKEALDDGEPYPNEEHFSDVKYWHRLYKYCLKNMKKTGYDELDFGDMVIFKINGDIHTGIYLGYGKLLAMQVPTVYGKSTSTIYHREWWTPFFKCAFRRKGVRFC